MVRVIFSLEERFNIVEEVDVESIVRNMLALECVVIALPGIIHRTAPRTRTETRYIWTFALTSYYIGKTRETVRSLRSSRNSEAEWHGIGLIEKLLMDWCGSTWTPYSRSDKGELGLHKIT